jgi:hypothetical protein
MFSEAWKASGLPYALAGFSGSLCGCERDNGLHYEFNLFTVRRTRIKASRLAGSRRQSDDRNRIQARG